jgi:uncharacterized protein (TIGR03790 family)
MRRSPFIFAAATAACISSASKGLEPADIAVIYNSRSPSSLQIAQHYIDARKIPMNHLIALTCDAGQSTTEVKFRTAIVPQLLKSLGDAKLLPDPKAGVPGVKCLVTVYGVPLRIDGRILTAAEKAELAAFQKQREQALADLLVQISDFEHLAAAPPAPAATAGMPPLTPPPATPPTAPPAPTVPATQAGAAGTASGSQPAVPPTWQALLPRINAAVSGAAMRVDRLPLEQKQSAMMQFIQMQQKLSGLSGLLRTISVTPGSPDFEAGQKQLQALTAQVSELQQQFAALVKQRDQPRARQEMVAVRTKAEGTLGQVQALDEMISIVNPENTGACFDNELAMLRAEQSYPRGNWVVNPTNLENYAAVQRNPAGQVPTFMVCRLDGASPIRVTELIDTAIKTEAKGLEGKMYLDARGLHNSDAYSQYDEDIRKTAEWVKAHSTMEVVLDDTPNLFVKEQAPDCALYCGWYSVRHFVDSCQWVQGGVGYHVASFEMVSLHDKDETGWVVNLLNKGFVGTLGPTDEPYLSSFPRPSLFFPLLLSGQFTQGEAWYLTTPMLSWREGWVGDPLYNPFKNKPRVEVKELMAHPILRNAFASLGRDVPSGAGK